ncbi:glycoside hydrolase family 13 protein [Curtobacterium sp. ISL-83]|uniref:glycoside hydrolase family 13 protein n=1 Tax=Curtobacterium sp. ISL-83 TaxID=2819145 RepID=UPI001BE84C8E|nr:glycoside hydrolase family 13 protein [Curtobacterium sp. ISL-83]MBT2502399.1 glycoside hydrolase family 13 protein [Curtobacterium sp. ISL-83]
MTDLLDTGTARSTDRLTDPLWWRDAVIYEIYPRSFADGNGDGTGDLEGVRQRLPYLAALGVDAIWFTPWYASPLADGGYDVADYRRVHPDFGTLEDAESVIANALALGIRTIVDVVPNHVSRDHEWFRQAIAAGPGSPERERFWFRDVDPAHPDSRPTDWTSNFGGPTWTQTGDGQWYLHLFDQAQPDLNWDHPDVRREHESILRFWLDRGVAGVRIDSAALLVKDRELPEVPERPAPGEHPNTDRDELHAIYRGWRRVADAYSGAIGAVDGSRAGTTAAPGTRALVGEIWLEDTDRFTAYLRPDELHTAFNFDFMSRPWDAAAFRESITTTLAAHAPVGAPATWVLSNHDVTRPVTRYGRAESGFSFAAKRFGTPTDLALGTRRARAAALLTAALPGSLYLYQGDELGLPEVEGLPLDALQDPMHRRSGGVDPGRDGCRVPLPWSGTEPPYGFSGGARRDATATAQVRATARTWLPQPADWATHTVEAQEHDPDSMLALYREAIRIRRERLHHDESFAWLSSEEEVLAFARGDGFVCVVNLSRHPVALPADHTTLLASADTSGGTLPSDAAVWLAPNQHDQPAQHDRPTQHQPVHTTQQRN